MELFIFLLIIGYFRFFKGISKQKKKSSKRASVPTGHPYASGRQVTFDELRERFGDAQPAAEGVDPCHETMFTQPRRVTPMEGVDPCHDTLFQRPERIIPQEDERADWQLDLSPEALRQAVVMQEVLTRPCVRRRRLCR